MRNRREFTALRPAFRVGLLVTASLWCHDLWAPEPAVLTASPGQGCSATAAAVSLPAGCYFWDGNGGCRSGAYYCVKHFEVWDYAPENRTGKLLYYRLPTSYVSCGTSCPPAGATCSPLALMRFQTPAGKVLRPLNGAAFAACR